MIIPDKIKIGGLIYDVKHQKNVSRDRGSLGISCGNSQEIEIEESLSDQMKKHVLIHEIIEQINFLYELDLPHPKILILEAAIYQVITDNSEVFKS